MKISETIVYVISQVIFWGTRKIAQEGGEILPKVSSKPQTKFREILVSYKFHQNRTVVITYNLYYYKLIKPW